jgi:thiol:disulfide interchange protein DsbD
MGALLGIVAAPCVGPVVAALLLYVGEQRSPQLGFVLFFALSLGFGIALFAAGDFQRCHQIAAEKRHVARTL